MQKVLCSLAAGLFAATSASAATIDLRDEVFVPGSVQYGVGPIIAFQEEADGVTFSFNASGQFRDIGPWLNIIDPSAPALTFGGGGGNTAGWVMTVSQDVTLNSYNGAGPLNDGNITAIFDIVGGSVSSLGNTFDNFGGPGGAGKDFAFASGPLSLEANVVYSFSTTNASANTTGHIFSLDFTKVSDGPGAEVPLPAGLSLLLAGLGALVVAKRRKS